MDEHPLSPLHPHEQFVADKSLISDLLKFDYSLLYVAIMLWLQKNIDYTSIIVYNYSRVIIHKKCIKIWRCKNERCINEQQD